MLTSSDKAKLITILDEAGFDTMSLNEQNMAMPGMQGSDMVTITVRKIQAAVPTAPIADPRVPTP
jgi:hypothetical protein